MLQEAKMGAKLAQQCSTSVPEQKMRQTVSKELFGYWSDLKGARSAPDRSEINPSAIRHVLADSFIIEVDQAKAKFPIRLCGTRLNALWLSEQRGKSFLDLWREQDRINVTAALMTVVEGVSPVVAGVNGGASGVEPVDFELLLLPLRYFGKTHSRIIGSLTPARRAAWFGAAPTEPLALKSLRVIDDAEQAFRAPWGASQLAALRHAQRRPPRFVVYEGGKSRFP
jgi:hypothetical protein